MSDPKETERQVSEILALFDLLTDESEITTDEVLTMDAVDQLKVKNFSLHTKKKPGCPAITTIYRP